MIENSKSLFSRLYIILNGEVLVEGCIFSNHRISCVLLSTETFIQYTCLETLYFDFSPEIGYDIVFLDGNITVPKEPQKIS